MGKSKKQKKAEKQVKKYYDEQEGFIKKGKVLNLDRLSTDLQNIMEESGIQTNRAFEDYIRNVGNIEANKSFDIDTLTEYVSTNTGRTQEDLDTSLAREQRRYSLEYDQINQSLADKGLTFSERTPEKIAQETSNQNLADITLEAGRSFEDIARYEASQTKAIDLKYNPMLEGESVKRDRTIEDIANDLSNAQEQNALDVRGVELGYTKDMSDIKYGENDAISSIGNVFDSAKKQDKLIKLQKKANG